jgi:Spy/CpxP family protein refolding chaperone
MFDFNSRVRHLTLGALVCVAAATVSACAHTQQAPPADSASPRSQGQGYGDGSRMRNRERGGQDRMFADLNLTTDQQSQIKVIRDRYRLRADSLRSQGAGRDSTSRAQFRSLMRQQMDEIRAVLNPDQQKKLDDKMAQMRERRQQRGDRDDHNGASPSRDNSGDNPPPPPPPAT